MSVRRRPENPKVEKEIDVDALIEKGAKVKEDHIAEGKKWVNFHLRIKAEMIVDIDDAVEKRVGITRTGWVLEAIQEKLKREADNE